MKPDDLRIEESEEILVRFHRLKRQMILLFPPDVSVEVKALDAALIEFASRAVSRGPSRPGTPEAGREAVANFKAFSDAGDRIDYLRGAIMARAHHYLRQYGWLETLWTPVERAVENLARRVAKNLRGKKA